MFCFSPLASEFFISTVTADALDVLLTWPEKNALLLRPLGSLITLL